MRPAFRNASVATVWAAIVLSPLPALHSQPSPRMERYLGMCDASAGVALDAHTFVVANDEDNVLRIYPAERGAAPIGRVDLNRFLRVASEDKPETDFEGASPLGKYIYWITSHGRNKDGKYRPARHRFFATQIETNGAVPTLRTVGAPYSYLLNDLAKEPKLRQYRLLAASTLPPKAPGGFNIEGLCATPEGHLLIGFRNPIPDGRALLVPMLNPEAVALQGQPARLGEPTLLDLKGLGIRDIARWHERYIIIAGSYHSGGTSVLYQWAGPGTDPKRIDNLSLSGINPEAVVPYPPPIDRLQILSDDGTLDIGCIECKQLPSASARSFRSVWIASEQLF